MNTILIEDLFDNIFKEIKSNVLHLTCHELYMFKERFYNKCRMYKGDTKDLTGITELLVSMFLKAFQEELLMRETLDNCVAKVGINGKVNEIDYAFLNPDGSIKYGISVKRMNSSITPKDHEKDSLIFRKYSKRITIVQDLFRLDNIKKGENGNFKSVTVIFKAFESNKDLEIMSAIKKEREEYHHDYIVLEGNNESLFYLLKNKLDIYPNVKNN